MARATRLVPVVCVGLAFAGTAAAQGPGAPYAGRVVTSVRIEVDGREVADPGMADLIETPVGAPLSLAVARESITHLFNLGRYQDIQIDATPDGAGVALRYVLVSISTIRRLEFQGELGLRASRLRRTLLERFNGMPSVGRATAAARALEDADADAGYMRARVVPSVRPGDRAGRSVLVFDVTAGPRARIGDLTVSGSPLGPPGDLLRRLNVKSGDPYGRAALNEALARYVADLRSRGHYEAAASHQATVGREGEVVDVTIDVQPGPLVAVTFEGDPLPPEQRATLVPVAREGTVDEDLLDDSDMRIEQYLSEQGYWRAQVAHRRTQANGRLNIVFTVKKGPQYRTAGVELIGNREVPTSDLQSLIRFKPGEPFVQSRLDSDVAAIEEYYRRHGYARARVAPSVELPAGGGVVVTPRITITEGGRTLVSRIRIQGTQAIPEADLRSVLTSTPGQPFYEPELAADRDALTLLYVNRGYESAQVRVDREFAPDGSSVELVYDVQEGDQSIVDHVLIVGNTRTKTSTIERELLLKVGEPLGLAALIESQQRLSALGLFRRVRITPITHGSGARKDLLVVVEEAPATSIGYGGGLEGGRRLRTNPEGGPAEERVELAPRGFFEVGRRNLWGKNRSITLFTRVSVRPSDSLVTAAAPKSGQFTEYRVIGNYREPRAFGRDLDLLGSAVLEQGVRTSFNFNRKGVNAELLRSLSPSLRLSGRYSFSYTRRFDERIEAQDQSAIDRLFSQVRISAFSGNLFLDRRDDAVDPTRGGWSSVDVEVAARALGSQVGFAKTYLQGFLYRKLYERGSRRLVLAAGSRLGLAAGFLRQVPVTDENGQPVVGPDGRPVVAKVDDVPASERFFAGGDTTVRGFTLDRLGTPATLDPNGFPKGGNAMLILNAELRAQVRSGIGGVVFVDAGNVYARVPDLDLSAIRPTAGFGLRYQSPIGPLRIDLGFKLDRQPTERLTALYFSFGQAF